MEINEEKVILMTKLAIYEESTGREDLEKGKYFKSDYVKYNCLKTLVSTTVLFVVLVFCYIYYNIGAIIEGLADMDYMGIAYKVVIIWAVSCLSFMAAAWVLYTYRYYKAKPKLIKYNQNLKKLIEIYDKTDKSKAKKKRRNR